MAFSEQLRDDNTNSDVIELADGKALVLHITGYQPKAAKPLAEIKEQVIAAIKHDKASEVARGKAQGLLDKLKAGENIQADLTALGLKMETHKGVARFDRELDQNLIAQAFTLPHPKDGKPSVALVAETNGDRVVVALDKVNVPAAASGMAAMLLALVQEFGVAQNIVTARASGGNLRLWHAVGSAMVLGQWLCAGAVLWRLSAPRPGPTAAAPSGASHQKSGLAGPAPAPVPVRRCQPAAPWRRW